MKGTFTEGVEDAYRDFANLEMQRIQWKRSGDEEGRAMRVRKCKV